MAVPDVRVSRGWISEGTSQPKGPLWVVGKQSRKQQYRQGASVDYTAAKGGKTAVQRQQCSVSGSSLSIGCDLGFWVSLVALSLKVMYYWVLLDDD